MLTKIAWRNIWRNRGRSLISMAAVFFCVFFAIIMRSMQIGSYDNIIDDMVGDFFGYAQIHQEGFWDEQILDNSLEINPALENKIVENKNVKRVVRRLESYSLVSSGNTTKVLAILGTEPENELSGFNLESKVTSGSLFSANNPGIVLAEGAAEYFKMSVGDTLVMLGQGYHGQSANGLYPIVGIVKLRNPEMNKNFAFLPLKEAQWLYGCENRITSYVLEFNEGVDHNEAVRTILNDVPEDYELMTYEEMMPELIQALQADNVGGLVMILVLYMIIGFVLLGTIIMMTAERIKEFGILIAVGMKKWLLIRTTVLENTLLSLIGGMLGFLVAMPIQWYYYKNPVQLTGSMEEAMLEYGYEPIMPFSIDWSLNYTHTAIVVSIALVVSIYAVIKIYTLKPVEAMRS